MYVLEVHSTCSAVARCTLRKYAHSNERRDAVYVSLVCGFNVVGTLVVIVGLEKKGES